MADHSHLARNGSDSLQDRCFRMLVQPEKLDYFKTDLGLEENLYHTGQPSETMVRMKRTDFEVPPVASCPHTVVASIWNASDQLQGGYSNPVEQPMRHQNGYFQDPQAKCNPLIVYCHSQSGCRVEGSFLVEYAAKRKMDLLVFDFPGCGQSQGSHVTLGWNESFYLSHIIEHVQTRFRLGKDQILLWGRSMGAVAAIRFISHESAMLRMSGATIAALVLDSPYADLMELTRHTAQTQLNIPGFLLSVPLMILSGILKDRVGMDLLTFKPIELVNSIFVPTLFIVAKDDKLLPKNTVQRMYSQCQSSIKQMQYCEGQHGSTRDADTIEKAFQFIEASAPRLKPIFTTIQKGGPEHGDSEMTAIDSRVTHNQSSLNNSISHNMLRQGFGQRFTSGNLMQGNNSFGDKSGARDPGSAYDVFSRGGFDRNPIRDSQQVNHFLTEVSDYKDQSFNRQSTYFDPFRRDASKPKDPSQWLQKSTQENSYSNGASGIQGSHASRPNTRIQFTVEEKPYQKAAAEILSSSILGSSGLRKPTAIKDAGSELSNTSHHLERSFMNQAASAKPINPLLRSFNEQPTVAHTETQASRPVNLQESPVLYKGSWGSVSASDIRKAEPKLEKFKNFINDVAKHTQPESKTAPQQPAFGYKIGGHQKSTTQIIGFGNSSSFGAGTYSQNTSNHLGNLNRGIRPQEAGQQFWTAGVPQQEQPSTVNQTSSQMIQMMNSPLLKQGVMTSGQSLIPAGIRSLDFSAGFVGRTLTGEAPQSPANRRGLPFNSVDLSISKDASRVGRTDQASQGVYQPTGGWTAVPTRATTDVPPSSLMQVFQRKPSDPVQGKGRPSKLESTRDPYLLYGLESKGESQAHNPTGTSWQSQGSSYGEGPHSAHRYGGGQSSLIDKLMESSGNTESKHTLGPLSVNTLSEFRGAGGGLLATSKGASRQPQLSDGPSVYSGGQRASPLTHRPLQHQRPLVSTLRPTPPLHSSHLR